MYKHVQSETNRVQSFALCLNVNKFRVFEYVSHSESNGTIYNMIDIDKPSDYDPENNILFLVNDYPELNQNSSTLIASKIFYLSSQNTNRYKDFQSTSSYLYNILEELKYFFNSSYYQWEPFFYKFGGVVRSLIKKEKIYFI